MRDHIVVIGAGKFGSYLASSLASKGRDVVLIDKDAKALDVLSDSFVGITIEGDAGELAVLDEAEITKAAQVIIVTDNDNTNIFIASICDTIYKVKKIFIRQSNGDKVGLLAGSNYNIIYPFSLSVQEYFNLLGDDE